MPDKMKTMKKSIRQGDLLFVPLKEKADLRWHKIRENGVIREGEATGHHHRLENLEDADVYMPSRGWNGQPFVVVNRADTLKNKANAPVVHPEHGTVVLEPDTTYEVKIAREVDLLGDTRIVSD